MQNVDTLTNRSKRRLTLNSAILMLCLFLSGCNRYSIETDYDGLQKTQSCSLKNNLLTLEPGYFSGTRRLELNLDKVNNETVVALFSLSGMNKSSFFKPAAPILFTLINPDSSREEIRLMPISPPQDKSSQEPIYVFLHSIGYMGVLNYQEKTASVILTQMTREHIVKISQANKLIFSIETTDKPIRGELDAYDLQPFREFIQACFFNVSSPDSVQKTQ